MWRCPKCRNKVDDSFEVCWSCGTTPEGVEDPDFVTADETEPIEDPAADLDTDTDDPLDDFAGTPWPELVECYMAATSKDTVRSRSFTGKPCRMLKNDWTDAWEAVSRGLGVEKVRRERSIPFGSRGDPCCSRKCLPLKMVPASRLVVRT